MAGPKTFTKIADHFRERILSGDLEPGAKLPTNREISGQWQVAAATVSRALQALQVEGYIRTTPRGTYVADDPVWTLSARDRLSRVQRVKTFLANGETSRVTAAELVAPPLYIAELFDLGTGDQVVRREWLAGRGKTRTVFAVTWYPAPFAALVPDLLNTAPERNHGLSAKVLEATNRTITHARDDLHARAADAREASALGLPVGSSILAGAHRWSDTDGVIEYGEWCLPPRFTIGYEYQP
ncbi:MULTISPECIES: GntR family transcriptional regulator [unclassified Streptomyces]|uniref:GntR family transcriptional regulator n=1 Tax=unclassified Streptomyces TaxID=2593676 RepID=UPI000367743A|nr:MULTISPECIES: GntR family transcriptional regulator [unclassified Streptomyces]MYT33330.1 UTRA domain-containing protein [Streptomyces sp. SID8354]